MSSMFFDGWSELARVVIVGVLAYLALLLLQRISGKRTLSKMNAFDLVVTVALGSTLATILLSEDVALVEGVVALALLMGLQYLITWASVRSSAVKGLVKAEPTLLFYHGRMLDDALRGQRVTRDEVLQAIRSQGRAALDQVEAVVLETDGTFSVIQHAETDDESALRNVARANTGRESGADNGPNGLDVSPGHIRRDGRQGEHAATERSSRS